MPRRRDVSDTLPVVSWYWPDWRGSATRARIISTENFVAGWCYRELCDAHWMTPDCSLTNDDAELASLAGVSLKKWLGVKDEVTRKFRRLPNGKFRNARTYLEWRKAKKNRAVYRRRASAGGKAKSQKQKTSINNDASSVLEADAKHASGVLESASPSPTPSPSPLTDNGTDNPPNPPAVAGGHEAAAEIRTTADHMNAVTRIVSFAASKIGLRFGRKERRDLLNRLKGGETEAQITAHYQDLYERLGDEPEEPPADGADFECLLPEGDERLEIVSRDDVEGRSPPAEAIAAQQTSGRRKP